MNTALRTAIIVSIFTAFAPLAANASPGPASPFTFVHGSETMAMATVSAKPAATPKMPAVERSTNVEQINADARRVAFRHLGTSL